MELVSLAIGIVIVFLAIKFLAPKQATTIIYVAEASIKTAARGVAVGLNEANKALKEYDSRPVDMILLDIIDDDKPTTKKK